MDNPTSPNNQPTNLPETSSSSQTPTETSQNPKTKTISEVLTGTDKANTVRYDVDPSAFGVVLKGPVYVMKKELLEAFGKLPKSIRIIITEAEVK